MVPWLVGAAALAAVLIAVDGCEHDLTRRAEPPSATVR
jgi:hypothetical protein